MQHVDLSIVIVSWNTCDMTAACLRALRADRSSLRRQIIVVDNASEDGTADRVAREHPEVELVRNRRNLLYAYANNQGAARARGRYIALLNSDALVRPGALDRLVRFLEANLAYAAASPKLVGSRGEVRRTCARFPTLASALAHSTALGRVPPGRWIVARSRMEDFDHEQSRDVDQPPTSCFVVRRRDWEEIGGFDARMSLYFNDVDLCFRLWQSGRRIRYVADAEVVHEEGGSTRRARRRERNIVWNRDREAYYEKRYGALGRVWARAVLGAATAEIAARIVASRGREAGEQLAALSEQLRDTLGPDAPSITLDQAA
ncbi:glycosyltransferase family 2 protein [Sandaracinus amylolyticus]|uniref:Glycosyl transferase, family 2 n=1 Tax=Sandaracinus amylolyticus TaxID=927083 RepID=A0A0F6SHU1_9BACT|nr:glycosyltransferase family 2 protein [Sandaracinus amylolyticus]AKF11034.1 Glycosyl transferase, family 2 [Sandaracinus amylolyticus]